MPTDLQVSNKVLKPFGPGVDYQNDGQYIVFPGGNVSEEYANRHGCLPGRYEWIDPTVPRSRLRLVRY